jgi:hypothetical protein
VHSVDRLGELIECRYPLVAEFQPEHPLRARDAIGLRAPQEEIGDGGAVSDEFTAHGGCLAVVDDLGSGAAAEVLFPGRGA